MCRLVRAMAGHLYCNKACLKWPHKRRAKIGFQDRLLLNAGQKYCRMLQGEHSAILSTFIKLPFVIKIFVLSIFEWSLKTGSLCKYQNLMSWFLPNLLSNKNCGNLDTKYHYDNYVTIIAYLIQVCTLYLIRLAPLYFIGWTPLPIIYRYLYSSSKLFEGKNVIIFLAIILNIFWGAQMNRLVETVQFEYPQHVFWLRNKKINFKLHTLIWRPVLVCFI